MTVSPFLNFTRDLISCLGDGPVDGGPSNSATTHSGAETNDSSRVGRECPNTSPRGVSEGHGSAPLHEAELDSEGRIRASGTTVARQQCGVRTDGGQTNQCVIHGPARYSPRRQE